MCESCEVLIKHAGSDPNETNFEGRCAEFTGTPDLVELKANVNQKSAVSGGTYFTFHDGMMFRHTPLLSREPIELQFSRRRVNSFSRCKWR